MSRSASLVTATVVALSLSSLFSASALAACADADQCTAAVCRQRQARVHPTCDVSRSCAAINANNKPELRRRLTINQNCLAARQNVGLCFSVPDQGHIDAINAVQAVIQVCQDKIDQ
jgi:hypothetical protein